MSSSSFLRSHDEDYRWAVLRKQVPAWFFQVTNLVFIGKYCPTLCCKCKAHHIHATAGIQNVILFLLGIPTYIAVFQEPTALSTSDYVLAALALIDIAVEFTADNQQYSFQTYKHSNVLPANDWPFANLQWTPMDAKRGFITKGLWAWSRHPNFLCEQTFWVSPRLHYNELSTECVLPDPHHTIPYSCTRVSGAHFFCRRIMDVTAPSDACARSLHALLLLHHIHGVYLALQVPRGLPCISAARRHVCAILDSGLGLAPATSRQTGES